MAAATQLRSHERPFLPSTTVPPSFPPPSAPPSLPDVLATAMNGCASQSAATWSPAPKGLPRSPLAPSSRGQPTGPARVGTARRRTAAAPRAMFGSSCFDGPARPSVAYHSRACASPSRTSSWRQTRGRKTRPGPSYRNKETKKPTSTKQEPNKDREGTSMVILAPMHDCSPEPEVGRDDRNKEPDDPRHPVSGTPPAGQGAGKGSRKRKGISTSTPYASSDEREIGRGYGSQKPGEAAHQELPRAPDSEKKRRKPSIISTLKKLQLRELGFRASFSKERFNGFNNVLLMDMYMHKNRAALEQLEPFMRSRSAISKIISVQDVLVLLSATGVCCTFSRVTNKMIAFVTRSEEMTEDIFYNKNKMSLIVSSSNRSDDHTEKRYRSILIRSLRTQNNTGCPIFASQHIKCLLVFDAVNGKALMRDGMSHGIFDLETQSLIYRIPETDVTDVLFRQQNLLVIKENTNKLLSLVIKSTESGEDIGYIYHPTEERLKHLEILHEKILIKERSKMLQVIDVKKADKKELPIGNFDYHALSRRNCFLTFQKDSTQIRSLNGTVIKDLENTLWKSPTNEHRICASADDDIVIFLAKSKASELGSVKVCSLGREVSVATFDPEVEVTCLSYNEDLNEIYCGTSGGRVYVYSV